MHAFRDLETAAYCPRKLYYRKRASDPDDEPPAEVRERRALAFRYERLLAGDEAALRSAPIEVTPTQFRTRLGSAKARLDAWDRIADPDGRNVFLEGREARGVAHKLLDGPEPSVSMVFSGEPPETGVWEPQSVRLVAAAKALSWERETTVDRVYAEYPAYGEIRSVAVGARRRGQYREAVNVARSIDGPPARTAERAKCDPCEYRSTCGVRSRSLLSRLSPGD